MSNITHTSRLYGEYVIEVFNEHDQSIYNSGWLKNTILKQGLIQLYDNDIQLLTTHVSFGKSRDLPGYQGYFLDNIIEVSDYSELLNIQRTNFQITTESTSRVYYSAYRSQSLPEAQTINEFVVRNTSSGFSRNVFNASINVPKNGYVVFQYRLKINHYMVLEKRLPFRIGSNTTFTIPITTFQYNIPYDRIYRNDNQLILLQNSDIPTQFGTNWPTQTIYGIVDSFFSTYNPVELGTSINDTTRTFTVSTLYTNVSARTLGLFNNINSVALKRNDIHNEDISLNKGFSVTKFKFPIALYNLFTDTFSSPYNNPYNISKYTNNSIDFYINYSWSEI